MIIAALATMLVAWGETRYQVRSILEDKAGDGKQWQLIRQNSLAITSHEGRLIAIERITTSGFLEDWGALKRRTEEDHRDLRRLLESEH